jgi:hypothetical protein
MRGRIVGSVNEHFYKWRISIYNLDNDTIHIDKYFSIKHFNDTHGTKHNSDHLQKLRKLREKLGDYTIDDVKNAKIKTPFSNLAKLGHLKFEKIREPVIYSRIVMNPPGMFKDVEQWTANECVDWMNNPINEPCEETDDSFDRAFRSEVKSRIKKLLLL